MRRSKAVAEKMDELYALMASVAAQKAIDHLKSTEGLNIATLAVETWALKTGKYLDMSSARSARWTYRTPRVV